MTTSGAANDDYFVKMSEGVDGLADYICYLNYMNPGYFTPAATDLKP